MIEPMFAPDGVPVVGVLQTVEAIASIEGVDLREGDPIYTGDSRVYWDSMEEKTGGRGPTYIDAEGRRWRLEDLRSKSGARAYRCRPDVRARTRDARRRADAGRGPSGASSPVT